MGFIYTKSLSNMTKYFMRIENKLNEYKRTGRIPYIDNTPIDMKF
jgi:hypothetical protein